MTPFNVKQIFIPQPGIIVSRVQLKEKLCAVIFPEKRKTNPVRAKTFGSFSLIKTDAVGMEKSDSQKASR